ncbi:MAG: hypothetical protein FWC61_04165 [Proteobacteria bacterium]|nr:hypothetical protein [Pseudomonadota bacterium]
MDKKDKLKAAANTVPAQSETAAANGAALAAGAAAGAAAGKCQCWLCRCASWLMWLPTRVWRWIKSLDLTGLANVALLVLIIVLFSILIINLFDARDTANGRGGSVTSKNAIADTIKAPAGAAAAINPVKTADIKAHVSYNADTTVATITLPLKEVLPAAATAPADGRITLPLKDKDGDSGNFVYIDNSRDGDVLLDGQNPTGERLSPMTEVGGNVLLQNMYSYTLPCGVKIRGNLVVRNVRLLKFCGCFKIDGNIYASGNSSFGPIPRDATLGGQVIF